MMKRIFTNDVVLLLSRFVLGTVFIVASVEKIAVPELFASSIQAYQMLPLPVVNVAALALPWIELISGVLLVAGVTVRASATILNAMLVTFIIAIVAAMSKGLEIDCGCFGSMTSSVVGWNRVLEDVGLLILGVQLMIVQGGRFVLQRGT